MNFVQPIRDPDTVRDIKEYFKQHNERDFIMFLLGVYLGRRITDTLKLKVRDVRDKDNIKIWEHKTKKYIKLDINPELKQALKHYCKDKEDNDYLIKSRKGKNRPIHRSTAYSIFKKAARAFNLESIGTHSLRKTFGYHIYVNNNKDIALAQKALNHESEIDTIRYLGIDEVKVNKAVKALRF